MKYLLGIDLGTSGTKTVLFDQNGKGICSATVEYPMYQPQNGWAEQDPKDWYNAAVSTIHTVLEKSGVDKEDVVSLGISGQMHGLVMLDEKDEVIRPSIIWCDQRTAKECEEITAKVGYENLIRITANPALPGFTLSKLIWVRNQPAITRRRFPTPAACRCWTFRTAAGATSCCRSWTLTRACWPRSTRAAK